jgi:hypothetical protein
LFIFLEIELLQFVPEFFSKNEIVPFSPDIVIGRGSSPKTTSVQIKGKKCQSDHEASGPPNASFQAYIIHYHGSTDYVVREAKEVLLLQKSRDHGIDIPI